LCEVQSDKASVEITSPFEGVLKRLLVQEGEVAKVGQGLCEIEVEEEDEGESMDPITSVVAEEAAAQVASAPHPETAPAPPTPKKERRPHPLDPSYTPPAASPPSTPRQKTSVLGADTEAEVLASPAVRSFARDIGIPRLSQLFPGSGKDGRILKTDVESFMSAGTRERAQQELEPKGKAEDVVLELSRTRRAMWKAMTKV
jgi:2-oxoisovalerate dehydrogenase E2 component (dihydrolipoyl transacylase)